ncbi:ABC transporter permease [[Eubacterium] cellulosolvens]
MDPIELVGLAFGALKERKLRSGLTILMVIIGAGLMTSINGLGGGMSNFVDEQLSFLGANVLMITPSGMGMSFGPSEEMPTLKLTSRTVRTIETTPGIAHAVPICYGVATIRSGGTEKKSVQIIGIDQSKLKYIMPKVGLESGSYVLPHDSIGIVLGHNIAFPSNLNRPLADLGQTVSIEYSKVESEAGRDKVVLRKRSFQVRGILEEVGSQEFDSVAFISLPAANAFFEKAGVYDAIYGITRDPEENDEVEERIRKTYGKNIGVTSPKAMAETIKDLMGTFESFLSAIAVVSMFVAAVGIITTLYTSVMERTHEIGLLKAIGYGKGTILLMFLTESVVIGLIGGLLGLVCGTAGAQVLIQIMPFGMGEISISPYFYPMDLMRIFILALALSTMAGLYPAWRASRLDPIAALRKE